MREAGTCDVQLFKKCEMPYAMKHGRAGGVFHCFRLYVYLKYSVREAGTYDVQLFKKREMPYAMKHGRAGGSYRRVRYIVHRETYIFL